MDDLTQLRCRLDGHVATLTLDAPPVNALTRVLNDELTLALDRISEMTRSAWWCSPARARCSAPAPT